MHHTEDVVTSPRGAIDEQETTDLYKYFCHTQKSNGPQMPTRLRFSIL